MFLLLRKIVICLGIALFAAVALYAYQRWQVFQRLGDAFTVWRSSENQQHPVFAGISGEVTEVIDGCTFQLKDPTRRLYLIRLTGIEVPNGGDGAPELGRALAGESKTNLASLILGKEVKVLPTHLSANGTGLGIVYLGQTNVNAQVLAAGMARLNPQFAKTLPFKEHYAMLSGQRNAEAQHFGIWKEEHPLPPGK
jgi:endonuclease YncB( thermonuclease family)